jgi:hypothetical protein
MVAAVFSLRHQSFRTDAVEIPICSKENRPKPRREIIFNNFWLIRARPLHFDYISLYLQVFSGHILADFNHCLNNAQNDKCLG